MLQAHGNPDKVKEKTWGKLDDEKETVRPRLTHRGSGVLQASFGQLVSTVEATAPRNTSVVGAKPSTETLRH